MTTGTIHAVTREDSGWWTGRSAAGRCRRAGRCAALLLVVTIAVPCMAVAQTISFTFDDGFDPRTAGDAATLNAQMLAALRDQSITTMLFPAGRRVDSPEGLRLVAQWAAAGHAIGNHSYAHRSFGARQTTVAEFTEDVERADRLLAGMRGWTKMLRFPYLKEGDTAEKRDQLRRWMTERGYGHGYVSIDTSDWYYSQRFVAWRARDAGASVTEFRDVYLEHLWNRATYYDRLAREVTGRSPAHVMLLHTNALNAAFLGDVIAMFRRRGWTIVSPAEAFADPVYARHPTTVPAGESVIWALAKEAGNTSLRYPAEDAVYEQPILDAKRF
jgi:peptidoglycan-N-acetylglucosamine deacetylase